MSRYSDFQGKSGNAKFFNEWATLFTNDIACSMTFFWKSFWKSI